MKARPGFHNHIVAALLPLCLALFGASALSAQDAAKLDDLYTRLKSADAGAAGRIEAEIILESGKSGSASLDLLLRRGTEALAAGNPVAATEHLTAALDHAPGFTEARAHRALALFGAGETGPAIADLAIVLEEEPRHFVAWSLLGAVLEETDQPERALAAFRRAAEIHPHIAEVNAAIARLTQSLEGQAL
ncbi:tetratricopeptide repeat protein [Pseudogemmobacter sp. CC-YST710]|uniref:Tetratricopeptide repeat protein n=2 Tax=Pseudogemmobacter faecipullorum TaxID=2755041 RepID=A0ABS8CG96_9RHOB|nr:tetratricopeptide repeat protein [Pseudogemmobacter faecipullorum]